MPDQLSQQSRIMVERVNIPALNILLVPCCKQNLIRLRIGQGIYTSILKSISTKIDNDLIRMIVINV